MDKNTTIGLVLIGLVLTLFTVFNQPKVNPKQTAKTNSEASVEPKKPTKASPEKNVAGKDKAAAVKPTFVSKKPTTYPAPVVGVETQDFVLQNENLHITLNNKGAMVSKVYLKKYKSYDDYVNKKDNSLCLFKQGDAQNYLIIPTENGIVSTENKVFTAKRKGNGVTFTYDLSSPTQKEKSIVISYALEKGNQLKYDIQLNGFSASSKAKAQLKWTASLRRTERKLKEQRKISTVCYDQANDGFDYLSESSDDYDKISDDVNWVAYKQSYFSSILHPTLGFKKDRGSIQVKNFEEGQKKFNTHIKEMKSLFTLKFNPDNKATCLWYFGSNEYKQLLSYHADYDDMLNYGWGLFRWINLYAVHPIFDFLIHNGVGAGLAILFLTMILKLLLMPVQWKMFVSSVKMRILKPEIEDITKKYPDKDQALKKQSEMMSLYKESGASPLAGCVSMLIQMPILIAVFRFFPASFELRQQPFLWAEDLSSFDSIWDFGFNLWPYGDHMSLFTLLMSGTTLLYTFMNSGNVQQPTQPGMPNMKVMMYIFPVLMIFFFNDYSAGLSYYYFISTLMSILIMVMIKKFFVNEDKLKVKMMAKKQSAKTDAGPKKKSKFQERLEEMQRKSIEVQKNKKK
jgi:YidC/Oxa1 family membrane protein insertase